MTPELQKEITELAAECRRLASRIQANRTSVLGSWGARRRDADAVASIQERFRRRLLPRLADIEETRDLRDDLVMFLNGHYAKELGEEQGDLLVWAATLLVMADRLERLHERLSTRPPRPTPITQVFKGPVMNDPKFNVTNIGSKIGAMAVGDNSTATGHVIEGGESSAQTSQEQFNQDVGEILHALTYAKERLETEQAKLIQLISGLLDLQVEGKSSDQVRAEIRQVLEANASKLPLSKLKEKLSTLAMGMASNGAYQLLVAALS